MSQQLAHLPSQAEAPIAISQLRPFNDQRFDASMVYFSKKYSRKLSQFDMMKLHVMTDIFCALKAARPVIGGALEPWQHGPVVKHAYNRVARWGYRFDQSGENPESFKLIERSGNANRFEAATEIDFDDFSEVELEAMDAAWQVVGPMLDDWTKSEDFFHNPQTSFVGRAWWKAREQNCARIDWNDIINAYDAFHGTDHSHIKVLMIL